MRSLPEDLRERIVKRYESGKDAGEVSGHFEVSERSVYRYVKWAREGGGLAPKPVGGSQSIVEREGLEKTLRSLVKEDSEVSLSVYASRLEQRTGVVISTPRMCRALQRLGLTRKKRPSNPRSAMRLAD